MSPPRRWERLLELALPEPARTEVLQDLAEVHALRAARTDIRRANSWYRRQALNFAWKALVHRRRLGPRNGDYGRRPMRADALRQDVRLAGRMLLRRPGYTLLAVATLALGIGANTAAFSAVNGVLIRPLPYDSPEDIVRLFGHRETDRRGTGPIAYLNFVDWRQRVRSFETMAAYDEYQPLLTGTSEPERLNGASVNASFFDVLGVRPAIGRFFLPEEDGPGSARSVVLSYGFWARRYGLDPGVLGSAIELNGLGYTVVGVAPASFEDPQLSGGTFGVPQVWRSTPSYFESANRSSSSFTAVGRLRSGVTLPQAQAELDAIMRDLRTEYPAENTNVGVIATPLVDTIVGEARTPLLVLLVAAGLVLLIACANVANLALVRALDGERDLLVRSALGASRLRLAGQLLVENALVAVMGGVAGLTIAYGGTRFVRALAGDQLARGANLAMDLRVVLFAIAATFAAGALFGLAPLLSVWRTDMASALREGGRSATAGRTRRRVQRGLVAAEVALSCALLIGAGLLVRSLDTLQRVDTGVRVEGTLTVPFFPPVFAYDTIADLTQAYRSLESRLASIPGVRAAGIIDILPMSGSFNGNPFLIEGWPEPQPGQAAMAETRSVTANVLPALGIEILRGRGIEATDREGSVPIALVNEALIARYSPSEDLLGKRLRTHEVWREIVGVVRDVHEFTPEQAPGPAVFLPREQAPTWMQTNAAVLVVRSDGDALALAPAVRATVHEVEPRAALGEIQTMRQVVDRTVAAPRFRTILLAAFAAVALLLAIIGIYGVVSRAVAQRRHELGIRMSLGAARRDVLSLVLRDGLQPVVIGIAFGLAGGWALSRWLSGMLFGVSAGDALTYLAAPTVLALTALLACLLPALRAARVDPLAALRT
jgi:putative ABC transport system permease protein